MLEKPFVQLCHSIHCGYWLFLPGPRLVPIAGDPTMTSRCTDSTQARVLQEQQLMNFVSNHDLS